MLKKAKSYVETILATVQNNVSLTWPDACLKSGHLQMFSETDSLPRACELLKTHLRQIGPCIRVPDKLWFCRFLHNNTRQTSTEVNKL